MVESVGFTVNLEARVSLKDNVWVAHCPSLEVYSQGDSREGAQAALAEAVSLWIESCWERGVLTEALKEAGFRPTTLDDAAGKNESTDHLPAVDDTFVPLQVIVPAFIAATLGEHAPC